MNRFNASSLGTKALSLLLATDFALCVPMTVFAEETDPVPKELIVATQSETDDPKPEVVPLPEDSQTDLDPQEEFEEQLAVRERVRLALATEADARGARDVSERDAQCRALATACRNAFAEQATKVELAPYNLLTAAEFQTLRDNLRCLPGGENAGSMELHCPDGSESPDYYEITYLTQEEQDAMQAAIDYFCSFADKGGTDFEKLLLVHDALTLNTEYAVVAYELKESKQVESIPQVVYDPYGILVDRKGVCQSYAYAFQIIMNKLAADGKINIPSIYVGSEKVNHAWNAVQLDGKWYHIDITWDEGAGWDVLGRSCHDNFLKSTSFYEDTHKPSGGEGTFNPNDYIGLVDLTNVIATDAANDTKYDSWWWDTVQSGLIPIETDEVMNWFYLNESGVLCSRNGENLLKNEDAVITTYDDLGQFTGIAMLDNKLYCATDTTIKSYSFAKEDGDIVATLAESWNLPNHGIACMDGKIYYAETQYPNTPNKEYTDYVRTIKTLDGQLLPLPPEPGILVDEENFPDEGFRNYVLTYIETDRNGYLSRSQRESLGTLDLTGKGFTDLTGINMFSKLKTLKCGKNGLTSLDVSQNEKLEELFCSENALTELNLNSALERLSCDNNQLTELDVSADAALDALDCSQNALTELDVSANPKLALLACINNRLRSLDVRANTKLQQLACAGNQLTELDLGANPLLDFLTCDNNHLAALNLSRNTALAADSTVEINDQILEREAVLEGDNWVVSLTDLPDFDAAKVVVEPGSDGYPRYENGKVILGRKGVAPRDSFGYFYATDSAIDKFYWMGVTVGVTPVYPAAPEPTAAAPAASAAPTPTPADNTVYIVCEACGYHDWVPYLEGYQCTHCGHLRGTTGVAATAAPAGTGAAKTTAKAACGIPNTGDAASPAAVVVVLLLSGFGVGCGVYKKKKTGR